MITQDSIDKVLDAADMADVIQDYGVKLKKKGTNFSGCCPFHDEKTPSFSVSPVRGMYKCFGCGKSGNAITFLMEKERMEFPDAVRTLAKKYSVELEETQEGAEDKVVKEKCLTMVDLNKDALKKWQAVLYTLPDDHWASVHSLHKSRMLTRSSIAEFQLGYAPDEWKFLAKNIVSAGYYEPAEELGLISRDEKGINVYDTFRDRLVCPIHNEKGDIIGFSARKSNDATKEIPKYINSKESLLYKKSGVLFGIFQARREIIKQGMAILVEGNFDVIMMHQAGIRNTVGTCGTALTSKQARKLKKYCNKVVVMYDGDKAGQDATLKAINILLEEKLNVMVVPLDGNDDPDELVRGKFPECCTEDETQVEEITNA